MWVKLYLTLLLAVKKTRIFAINATSWHQLWDWYVEGYFKDMARQKCGNEVHHSCVIHKNCHSFL